MVLLSVRHNSMPLKAFLIKLNSAIAYFMFYGPKLARGWSTNILMVLLLLGHK